MHARPVPARGSAPVTALLVLVLLGAVGVGAYWLVSRARTAERPARAPVVSGEAFPRTLHTPSGEELLLPTAPRRVVPSASATTDLVAALVGPERVAGMPRIAFGYSHFPGGPERWRDVPTFERYLAEPLLALEPDLVVAYTWQDATPTALLRSAGVPVLMLPEAPELASMLDQLELVGAALGTEGRAAELRASIEARVDALGGGDGGARARWNAMFYSNQGVGGWVAADGTTHDLMLRLAGIPNAAAQAGLTGHATIDLERLLVIDPDVLVVSESADGDSATRRFLADTPAAQRLTAVREGRLVVLPSSLYDCASFHVVTGAERLAEAFDALLARDPAR